MTAEDIQAEAERILRELRAPDVPNSHHGTHYMARISPEFLNRAGSKDHGPADEPFAVSQPGLYRHERTSWDLCHHPRSKELRQPRPSIWEHLKQETKQAAPKGLAHKKREPER